VAAAKMVKESSQATGAISLQLMLGRESFEGNDFEQSGTLSRSHINFDRCIANHF